ncbi:MAG: DJ-1/PfpI family protein [Gammaproteobacteria bacterium]|nr:DJ-1/PfpI family protein [Gammaproteobacteria bacterium]
MKTLGILLFPDFETLDVFGPLEMFGQLSDQFKIILISEQQGLVKSTQGQSVMTDVSCADVEHLDLLLVPGGIGTRREIDNQTLLQWIKSHADQAEMTLSVCTGAALLAKAGVLDGYQATTNKLAFDWVAAQSTQVQWIKKARWVADRDRLTSSGISAGIDMSLYLISRLFGEEVRAEIVRKTEYTAHTDPSDDPFAI